MSDGPIVLVIDDEAQIRRFLRISLEANQYRVREAVTGQEGLEQAALLRPDIVILDLGLPDRDGLQVLARLREWSRVPVIVLSVRDADSDKIAALDAGADDYLTKPFSVGELLARLRVAQRHTQPVPEASIFQAGTLTVDLARRVVTVHDEAIKLTATEYAFLRLLVRNAGRVLTHHQILREVWGPQYVDETHYLRVYAAQLRRKLEENPAHPQLLLTEPGVGYRFTPGEWVNAE
jgi:two-component system, OmpR family, KDP operon response regulator KdpE